MKKDIQELYKLIESAYKLERKLSNCVMTLKLEIDTHVPDLMTRIRVLPGVAVVAQKDKVARFFDGDSQLKIIVKYLPENDDIISSINGVGQAIKELPGVIAVVIHEYNKRKITLKGKRIVI